MILTTIIFPLAFLYIAFEVFKVLSRSMLKNLEAHPYLKSKIEKAQESENT